MDAPSDPFGLYVHVPFCRALCHYCDFAKTANFSPELAAEYLDRLAGHLMAWMGSRAVRAAAPAGGFSSVFFGGGTPSLFTHELAPLFAAIMPYVRPGAEISLEANPDDVTTASARLWRELGVNRLSIGVQTFDAGGLARLKRVHGALEADDAIAAALAVFPSVNADLIYGWQGQDEAIWRADLDRLLAHGVQHVSLYNLTYAEGTPIGRAVARGKLAPDTDERLAGYYETARAALGNAGYEHEEVSNWSKPGHSCRHNWLYWSQGPFIGLGAGAHGFLPEWGDGAGVRWDYPRSERRFAHPLPESLSSSLDPAAYAAAMGCDVHSARTAEDWLLEYVGCALRTERGVDLARIRHKTGLCLVPRPTVARALTEGILRNENGVLRLECGEWFRETAWSLELILSLVPGGAAS